MRQNVTFSIGNVALIEKADVKTGFFKIFQGISGKARDFVPLIKLLIWNKLDESYSIDKLPQFAPPEMLNILGFKKSVSSRTANRTLERLGERHDLIINKFQEWIQKQKLVDINQLVDFTSTYFEGKKCPIGKIGYSRDDKWDKLQITLGISTGINGIPTMLTISEGNEQDKSHMKKILNLAIKVCDKGSLFIFDCGGNSKNIQEWITNNNFNFLTLMAKHAKQYKKYIRMFEIEVKIPIIINEVEYNCVKVTEGGIFRYIFFCEKLKQDQLEKKRKKFEKALEKGEKIAEKVRKGKILDEIICPEGFIFTKGVLQKTIENINNPFLSGIEGYFILESSVDSNPETVLKLYKDRGLAENFIRDLKEGAEMHPIRHWSKNAVIGYILIIFLAKFLVNLTLLLAKNPLLKNLKLHKKYLMNLTLSTIYPKNYLKLSLISNYSAEMKALFGDFIKRFGQIDVEIQ